MTCYEQGFMNKCAEYGIDGQALLEKLAERDHAAGAASGAAAGATAGGILTAGPAAALSVPGYWALRAKHIPAKVLKSTPKGTDESFAKYFARLSRHPGVKPGMGRKSAIALAVLGALGLTGAGAAAGAGAGGLLGGIIGKKKDN